MPTGQSPNRELLGLLDRAHRDWLLAWLRRSLSDEANDYSLPSFTTFVSLVWALVVGVTGVLSACADLLIDAWRQRR